MRFDIRREDGGYLLRLLTRRAEIAYIVLGLRGLQAEIEFPSDWHESRQAWVCLGFGVCTIAFAFPWPWVVPDHYQCSGPTFGFKFFGDMLFLHWGKAQGKSTDPSAAIYMPWSWRHREHKMLTAPETHPYTYVLRNGTVQSRAATIQVETRTWTRPWLPRRLFKRSIDVRFSDEVGERTGSWKGGTTGCGYDMLPGETPLTTLRRMEQERKF